MSTLSAAPVRVAVILLAEYEKVRVFVIVDPMFWFNCATSDLPGWSQSEPTVEVLESPHRIVLAATQESWV